MKWEESRSIAPDFQIEDVNDTGRFGFNTDAYRGKQVEFANDIMNLTGMYLFEHLGSRFDGIDYKIAEKREIHSPFKGSVRIIPGLPILSFGELKYREQEFGKYNTTVVDSEKLEKLNFKAQYSGKPVYIIFRYWNGVDMYYEVNPLHHFEQVMLFNRNAVIDPKNPKDNEFKEVSHIPIRLLRPCEEGMFK